MLTIQSIAKTYGKVQAVQDVSFTIPTGEVMGLLGHNGAGKSTIIKMILGILEPDSGEILWNGVPMKKAGIKVGYLPEERGLYEKTKVFDQLAYFGKLENMTKKEIHEQITYWLERLNITEYKHKTVQELSKGNKQKIQLIASVLHNPDLIVLDEPFSGLDPINANVFAEVIQELVDAKKTIILSSHRMEQLDTFCQQLMILQKGKVLLEGSLDGIKKSYGVRMVQVQAETALASFLGASPYSFVQKGDLYEVEVASDTEANLLFGTLKENGYRIRQFVMREPTLHEIFVEVVSK